MAVATGKSRKGPDRVLQARCLSDFFDGSRCADETAGKPDPRMINELLREFGVQPSESLMVGDTEFDMAMAVNAKTPRIAVSYGAHSKERLKQYQPLACMDRFNEIKNILSTYS